MSKKMEKVLEQLESSCTSEGNAVADCLRTIAANGGDMATDKHLLACAQEIGDWARFVIRENGGWAA